ncbi:MAG: cytochrome c biogenesis protein CcsA [Saprospiraceae bacterium]|nr:cytochrome c biogenesis protein CcsA [Saprospiraceae bacterium]
MLESFYYTSDLFQTTCYLYLAAFISYLAGLFWSKKVIGTISLILFAIAFITCTVLIVDRWIEAGRPPFKTFFESLMFAVWTTSLVSLAIEGRYRIRLIGLFSLIGILMIIFYALPKRDIETITLPPALQTWLFVPHVISYFLAYGALFVGGIAAFLHLVKPQGIKSHHSLGDQNTIDFNQFTYEITKFGFLFLTIGLLLGAWWGQLAWSNYWGWDPKENWAFITWLIFAAYLHCRNLESISTRLLSWVVIAGVFAIVFTYLGMEMLPTANDSLHVYSTD